MLKICTFIKMKYLSVFSFLVLLSGCEQNNPQRIVDGSIDAHGGKLFEDVHIEFDFRNRHYTSHRQGGVFTYTREFTDTSGNVKDVFSNESFHREINGNLAKITEERAKAYSNSVNSVIYFALLPYGLNDAAVEKTYATQTEINGKKYHVIKVTFQKEGGGKDYEDVFLYWIDQESKKVDYLAYTYESDGGGIRFREAMNRRTIEGILFQDYINYEPSDVNVSLDEMENLYKNGQLKKLSDIVLENITVKPLSRN
jgi:hypothetical protein